jgi:hypothetical protein
MLFRIKWQHLAACVVGLALWALILSPAWASGDDLVNISKNENMLTGGDQSLIGGDNINNLGGGDSLGLAFAHALGDVDINDCLASTQWGTIIVSKQKVVPNMWCMGEVYDRKGMFELAAISRCSVPAIRAWFTSDLDCKNANTWSGRFAIDPDAGAGDTSAESREREDRDDQHRQEVHRQEVADALARMDILEQRLVDEGNARRRAVKVGMELREAKRADDYDFATQQLEQFTQMIEDPAATCTDCKTGNE